MDAYKKRIAKLEELAKCTDSSYLRSIETVKMSAYHLACFCTQCTMKHATEGYVRNAERHVNTVARYRSGNVRITFVEDVGNTGGNV
jgi:hypothetical protein